MQALGSTHSALSADHGAAIDGGLLRSPTGRRSILKALGAGALGAAFGAPLSARLAHATTASGLAIVSGLAWPSGAAGDAAGLAELRGRPVDLVQTFPAKKTWNNIRTLASNYNWLTDGTSFVPETVVVSYPLFPIEQSPQTDGVAAWQAGAGGLYDSNHDAAALSLARYAPQQFVIRLGWEWNLTGFPWACNDVALVSYYTAYFRRVVDRFRQRVPNVLIDWCGGRKGATNAGLPSFYPGDDWVDFIGLDCYDWYPAMTSQAVWDKEYNQTNMGGPRGLGTWLSYAMSQGKKLSFGEWGVVSGVSDGGGDNPFFITQMLDFFATNAPNIAYECYFNTNHLPNIHCFDDNPNAAAAYAALLGNGA